MATFPKDTIFQTFSCTILQPEKDVKKGIFTPHFHKLLQQLYYITLHDNRQNNENTITIAFGMP